MGKVAWVTDSTACLDEELAAHPDVYVVPMTIIMDGQEYIEGRTISAEDLFRRLKTLSSPPKTSQPSVGSFQALFEELEESYDSIVAVLVSAKLSGTVSSSQQAAQLVNIPVYTVDSGILSYPLTRLIKEGMLLTESGIESSEAARRIEEIGSTSETLVLVGSLEQLHRSGRMSGLQFYFGSLLSIKPIIAISGGALSIKEKARSIRKARERMKALLKEAYVQHGFREVFILYGLYDREAKEWMADLRASFQEIEFSAFPLGATIGVHAGENTIGFSWFNGLK
ncbi:MULTISPECIES: DegV family protein [Bacillaceae]|uniref:DegV family protein n=1 Tax=Bacillaceae TaxID=186817 RepID=UPI000C793F65|nr:MULTISPECIES: DegV family protein [Bacillus]MCP1159254.1 DegV family protein [Bacillus infantis]MDT0160482.1 DegV family protein [Bacillus sp. AG4(2022)]MDW2875298.1 DegV family protein [Bacillus infantis]PLR72154.1 DegV family protein [Bacillus sp. UMB0728]RYI31171.1 DegV family protein [Bacillus infantis]